MLRHLNILSSSKSIRLVLVILLLTIAIFFRVYKIASIPPGLNQDETAIGYNAYSIAETGKDEWGTSYPLYFKSFGDQKLPGYIYTTALFVKFMGLNEYAVRLPSAIAGIIAVFVLLYLVWYLTKNFTLAYISAFLLAITPWHIQFSRSGFEVNFALTSALIGVTLFIVAVDKKKILLLLLSLAAFSISLYSYNVTRLLSPMLLLACILLNWKNVREFKFTQLIIPLVFLLITLAPFFISFFSTGGVLSAKSSLITSTDVLAKDIEMRSYLISAPSWYTKIFYNQYIYLAYQYVQNLALLFSGSFFFVDGSSHPHQSIGNVGVFYLFQLPFFILGIVIFFLKKVKQLNLFLIWLLAAALTLSLSKVVPHATRGYFLVIPVVIFFAFGLLYFVNILLNIKKPFMKSLLFIFTGFFIFYNLQFYLASYYFRFP
ncbi:MAG TPA: glycosyltransferase family 39 protein, partial [Candidatus Nitrosocosmicus sp.]|nr:glycosyltransferase family 39 protein [Candidatus Nitrosocosmicus sp.]